ncbi:MAG: polysaccharide deacetylase family protein [Paludibacter sp.]|nr:polysaccharide deacetylase family protein [Paludibacter sp.]
MNIQFPDILRPLMGKLTWRRNPASKVIYLTFDDGPVPEVTPFVLDILKEHNLKATFFCVGENVNKYPEIYADILSHEHKTGNHTFHHLKGYSVSKEEYLSNVKMAAEYIDSKLFRPPYGRITFSQRRALQRDYEIIMWDLITRDYNRTLTTDQIMSNIKRFSRNGSIVVFHDSVKAKNNVLNVLPLAIEWWKSEGYEFESL